MRLVDLFPNAPSKVIEGDSDESDDGGAGADVEEDLFDALNQKLSPDGWAARQDDGKSTSKSTRPRALTRWLTL